MEHLRLLSKILEKEVVEQLTEPLIINNLYEKFQSAYRCNFCIETALIKITDGILNGLDNKSCTVLMIFDKSSAFDSIDHHILLHRFSCLFDVRSSVLSWFHSNLCNRTQL